MNGAPPRVRCLLADPKVITVVVEYRDRLGRVNTELVDAAWSAHSRRLVVLNDGKADDNLVGDMDQVLTALCARLYGHRSARNKVSRHSDAPRGIPDRKLSEPRRMIHDMGENAGGNW